MLKNLTRLFRALLVLGLAFGGAAGLTLLGSALLPPAWDGFAGMLAIITAVLIGGALWRWALAPPSSNGHTSP